VPLTNRSNPKAQRLAAIGLKGRSWVVAVFDQLPAQRQDRGAGADGDAECGAGVLTNQFGVDDLAGGGV